MTQLPLEGILLPGRPAPSTPDRLQQPGDHPAGQTTHLLVLPSWDTAWVTKTGRGGWPKVDPKTGKPVRHRPVWDALRGNSRNDLWAQRHKATKQVITAVTEAALHSGLTPCGYMDVTLVWSPGDRRRADEDNLWPLLKACCDALARGRRDLPGLHLVPDDDSRYMRKTPRIDRPPVPAGLWLEIRQE